MGVGRKGVGEVRAKRLLDGDEGLVMEGRARGWMGRGERRELILSC